MLKIAFLLMGTSFIRKRVIWILLAGIIWSIFGVSILFDALDGLFYFPITFFALVLFGESIITLVVAFNSSSLQKILLYFKGSCFLFISILILVSKNYSNLLLAITISFSYLMLATLSIITTILIRFEYWKKIILKATFDIGLAIFLLIPFTPHHQGIFEIFLGILMCTSGTSTIYLAIKIIQERNERSMLGLFSFNKQSLENNDMDYNRNDTHVNQFYRSPPLIVHIWTPKGSAKTETINLPIINRYIAALDRNGYISTGHAALEISNQIYISLYPAEDIERSPSEFLNIVKATKENNISGEFKTNYQSEANEWRASNIQIRFYQYNVEALQTFWASYQQDSTYNLSYRNCSSSVAYALEAALYGVLSENNQNINLLRILIMPELWIAAQIRRRAIAMAWTPGLVMDYARALHAIIHPAPKKWYQRFYLMMRKKLIKSYS